MVRFPPCVDMTHLRACPPVGRLRARDVMPRRLQAGGTSHGRTSRAGRQAGVRFSGGGGAGR